jgi:hypothetical protein
MLQGGPARTIHLRALKIVNTLRRILANQRKIRGDERPFLVAHIGRIRPSVLYGNILTPRSCQFITPFEGQGGTGFCIRTSENSPSTHSGE